MSTAPSGPPVSTTPVSWAMATRIPLTPSTMPWQATPIPPTTCRCLAAASRISW